MKSPNRWSAIVLTIAVSSLVQPIASAAEYTIQVDGISGVVSKPVLTSGTTKTTRHEEKIFEPRDRVTVQVTRANLITYGYRITMGKKEPLVVQHVIIGGPTVPDSPEETAAAAPPAAAPRSFTSAGAITNELIRDYEKIAKDLRDVERTLADLRFKVDDTTSRISTTMCPAGQGWSAELAQIHALVYCKLTGSERKTPSGNCFNTQAPLNNQTTCSETGVHQKLTEIEDALAALDAKLAVVTPAEGDTALAAFQGAIQTLKTGATNARAKAKKLTPTVDRWMEVMLSHPDATFSETFVIEDVSTRYTVGVRRFPAPSPPEKKKEEDTAAVAENGKETKDDATAKPEEMIASVVFEGHAFSRLNFALGLAHAYRSHNDTFEVVKKVGTDDQVTAAVQRKTHDTIQTKPLASLGVYLFPVDGLVTRRKPVPMLSVGVEVAEKPDYFAGIGLDWPSGLTISAGVTRYQKTQLAPGWTVGQSIPLKDGEPVLASPITSTSTAFAPYLAIQFRPTIFKAFSNLFKPAS